MRDFTPQELESLTKEVNSFKTPIFSKIFENIWFSVFKYYMIISLGLIFILGVINNLTNSVWPWFWSSIEYITYSLFFIGFWGLFSYLIKQWTIKNKAKELGLTLEEWNSFIK